MRLTINKFLIIFFFITSILPILGLGIIHVNYIHKILNTNQSFLKLIEHEEFILFCIYSSIVVVMVFVCLVLLRIFVIRPFREVFHELNKLAKDEKPTEIPTNKIYLYEVNNFIERFNEMIAAQNDAKQERIEFITALSHDLKVPLIAEQKAFEILKKYNIDVEKRNQIVESLDKSNKNLLDLISTIVDSFKFELGRFSISKKEQNLAQLVEESISALYPLTESKKIKIKNLIDKELLLEVDKTQIKRVFNNILHNSLKNSPNDSLIEIKASKESGSFIIHFKDSGYGIANDKIDNIFNRFFSINKSGTGLGLYISKLIVQAHNGEITARSQVNVGTEFEIKLPA